MSAPPVVAPTPGEHGVTQPGARDRAIRRIVAEIEDGLRHGHFEFGLTSEVIGGERRRLVLRAGKSYQFVLPPEECS